MRSWFSEPGRPLAIAALGVSALWVLLAFTEWRDLASGPRVGVPWTTYGYGHSLLFETKIQFVPVIAVLLWNLATAAIGYRCVVRPVFGARQLAAPVWLLIAGHIPGMLLIIAASRIVTLALPNTVAPGVLIAGVVAAAVVASYGNWQVRKLQQKVTWRQIWPVLAALLATLMYSVHVDRVHVLAEGSIWFVNEVFLSQEHGIGTGGSWPLISQHYDEAAFLYPIVYGLVRPDETAGATLTAIYWLLLTFGRLGALSLAYIAVRALGVDRLSSLISIAFFCGASLSVNPLASRLLFDSLSPLAYVLHVSRFLAPVLPLLLIAAITAKPVLSWQSAVIAALLGIGLSSMSVHVVIVLVWALGVGALTLLAPEAARTRRIWLAAVAAALALMAAFSVTYGVQSLPDVASVLVLLAGGIISAAMLLAATWLDRGSGADQRSDIAQAVGLLLVASGGYVLGLLLLGNVLVPRTLQLLAGVWPWSGAVILERFYSTLATARPEIVQSAYCDGGYWWGYRWLTGHCSSLAMFARTYGLAPVIMTAVLAWWLIRRPNAATLSNRILTPWLAGIVVAFVAMPFGFAAFDFVSSADSSVQGLVTLSIWLRSRLIEPWFYGGAMLALALYLRFAAAWERRLAQSMMMIATALFALSPFALPSQFIANIAFLFDAARGP